MQGSFPNGTPSTNRQDSNRHDRSIVNGGYARRQYISARPNLHNVPPNASYELQDGSRSSSRLWQFSPSMVPDRHEGFSADNEAASSPPPDAANKHAHPEGTSTAAAYNSPLLHTAKTAQRRFKPNTLYEEYDQRPYINDTEGTPTVANRPSLQTYRSHSSAKIHLIPRDNDHVYAAVPPSAALKDNHPKPANRYLSQALPLLPLPLQRLWRRQRKKSSSSDIHRIVGRPQSARANSRLGLVLVVCMSLVVFVWLLRHAKTTPAENRAPEEDSGANVSEPAKALVPTWKWWSPPQQTVASKPKKVKRRPTSFAKLRHTFEELLALPSKNSIPSPPAVISREELSATVTVIIDCIGARDPLGTDKRVYVNSFLSAVFAESVQIASVRFLLSPDDFPHANPGLLNFETGKIKLFTISDSVTNHLSTPAFDDLASDYVHLVRCPSPGRAQQRQEYSASSHISTLVQIAGTEEYGSRALSTAGIAKSQPGLHGRQPIMAYGPHASEERHEEIEYRLLTESRPLDVPYSNLLIFSSWLNALSVESALEALGSKHNSQYDLIASVGQLLRDQLHIECWALPLGSPFSFEASPRELLNFADNLQEAYSSPDQSDFGSKSIGTPARIAVLVSSADEPYASSWETILCSIAEETIYGHEVRLFVPHDIKDSHLYTLNCPEVEVHPLHGNSVQAWAPDICLTASESQLDISVMSLPYTHVSVPGADLGHMDWLAALPLESLLNWHVPKVDLTVVTHNRPASLHRLLASTRAAHYLGDRVNLFLNLEQTADDETRMLLEGSKWPFGDIFMRHRVVVGGLMTSIVESWYPADNDTYGVLLEDDVEVSPLFYSWLKFTILYYRYGPESIRKESKRLYGVSLYQPKNIELRPEGRRKFDAHKLLDEVGLPSTLPYLSQIPCSWGAVYFPEHWKEFHQFLAIRLSEAALDLSDPIVPNIRSNRWPNSWKRYLIELVYLRGYSMLYPNYADFRSLSTNHLEQGTHVQNEVSAQKRRDLFEVPLLTAEDNLMDELRDGKLPSWPGLPIFDLWGSLVNEAEIIERGRITFGELELCPKADAQDTDPVERGGGSQTGLVEATVDHDASRLLCTGPLDEQDWREWRMRLQHGANEIDANMLLEKEARLVEREKRVEELERQLLARQLEA